MRKSQWLLVSLVLLALLPALAIGGDASSAGKPRSKHAQTLHAKHRASLVTQLEDAAKAAEDGEDKDGEEKDDGEEEEKKWWDEDDKEGLSNLVLVMFVIGFVIMAVAAVFFLVMAFRSPTPTQTKTLHRAAVQGNYQPAYRNTTQNEHQTNSSLDSNRYDGETDSRQHGYHPP
eukprot:1913393-Rhodomonas_salina.2